MNNFERQETIDEMVAAHTPRELAGMVLDAKGMISTDIPDGAKYRMIGEFSVTSTEHCTVCDFYDVDEDCEICGGEYSFDVEHSIPWTTQKDIFNKFCEIALEQKK